MNFAALSSVVFNDNDSLNDFLLENGLQHKRFNNALQDLGFSPPSYPLIDVDRDNFDDWLLVHQNEHLYVSSVLGLSNPFNMLDADFRREDDFYEWLAQHYLVHQQIAATLGIS